VRNKEPTWLVDSIFFGRRFLQPFIRGNGGKRRGIPQEAFTRSRFTRRYYNRSQQTKEGGVLN